ncbi:hypothetical protein [Gulbenkiania mobilis]|nr:hypothetical protein [Gulbenkiania mobilis]
MKKRFIEEQIIGFLRKAEAGMPLAEGLLSDWRTHTFDPERPYEMSDCC